MSGLTLTPEGRLAGVWGDWLLPVAATLGAAGNALFENLPPLLTGTSLALVNALGIHDRFGFSAGAIDFLLNFRIAQQPILPLVIGIGYGALYYFLFRFVIVRWNLHTPGREVDGETADLNNVLVDQPEDVVADPITRNDDKTRATGERPAPTPVG